LRRGESFLVRRVQALKNSGGKGGKEKRKGIKRVIRGVAEWAGLDSIGGRKKCQILLVGSKNDCNRGKGCTNRGTIKEKRDQS